MTKLSKVSIIWPEKEKDLAEVDVRANKIIGERKERYSDNWAVMAIENLLGAAMYKADRARFTEDLEKKLDDIIDGINYLRFSGARIIHLLKVLGEAEK